MAWLECLCGKRFHIHDKEAVLATLQDLDAAIAALKQTVDALAAKVQQPAAEPDVQAEVDAVNQIQADAQAALGQ